MGQLLHYNLIPPAPPENSTNLERFMVVEFVEQVRKTLIDGGLAKKEDNVEQGGQFLVGVQGRLFKICDDFQVAESLDPYMAAGCGEDFILGSFHTTDGLGFEPRERVRLALEAATYFSGGVSEPFNIERLN